MKGLETAHFMSWIFTVEKVVNDEINSLYSEFHL